MCAENNSDLQKPKNKAIFFIIGLASFWVAAFISFYVALGVSFVIKFDYVVLVAFIISLIACVVFMFRFFKSKHRPQFRSWLTGAVTGIVISFFLIWGFISVLDLLTAPNRKVGYPNKEEIIASIEAYKKEHGQYPEHLDLVGFGKYQVKSEDVEVGANYWPRDEKFTLCYIYATPVGTEGDCYKSKTRKWERR